jgi:hypothetical protein
VLDRQAVLQEIDDVLARCGATPESPTLGPAMVYNATGQLERMQQRPNPAMMVTSLVACIERNAPRDVYARSAHALAQHPASRGLVTSDNTINKLIGVLIAVRQDIDAGYVRTLEDRARDALSDDLLVTASSIAKQNAGAAIVLAVSVLEEHIRKLAAARGNAIRKDNGSHRSFEDMSADLLNADVLTSSEKRLMGGWYAQRTSAAHGHFDDVIDENAPGIIDGVRHAIVRHPS